MVLKDRCLERMFSSMIMFKEESQFANSTANRFFLTRCVAIGFVQFLFEVTLTITVLHRFVFVDTKRRSDVSLVEFVVQYHQRLADRSDKNNRDEDVVGDTVQRFKNFVQIKGDRGYSCKLNCC